MGYEDMIMMQRPASGHLHMSVKNRAKQFAPFDALRGFGECIREQTVLYTDRPSIAEDRKEELNRKLQRLQQGDRITVLYFKELPQGKWQKERPGKNMEEKKKQRDESQKPIRSGYAAAINGEKGLLHTVTGRVEFLDPSVYLRVDETEIQLRDIIEIGEREEG